jgi:hypothetical protein
MWKPLITKRSASATSKLRAAQTSVTLIPRAEEASMSGRTGLPKGVLGLATGIVLLAVLGFSASAASSRNQALRQAKPFHLTKDCSGSSGKAGAYCTIRSSNVKAIRVGSKIFYLQPDTKSGTDSDIVIYVGPGTVATGHCRIFNGATVGLCTVSDGTGALAGFHMRARVTADHKVPNLYHWDGTYGFGTG